MIEHNYELIDSPALSRGFPRSRTTQEDVARDSNSGGDSFGRWLIKLCYNFIACFGIRFGDSAASQYNDFECASMLLDERVADVSNRGNTHFSTNDGHHLAEATGQALLAETHFGGISYRSMATRPRHPSPPTLEKTFYNIPPKRKQRLLPRIPLVIPVGDGYDQQRRDKYYAQYLTSNEAAGISNGMQRWNSNDFPTKQQMDNMVYLLNEIKKHAHARKIKREERNKQQMNVGQCHGCFEYHEYANAQVDNEGYWQHLDLFSCSKSANAPKAHLPQLREQPKESDGSFSSWSVTLAKIVKEMEADIIVDLKRMQMDFENDTEEAETISARDRYMVSVRAARRLKKNKNRAPRIN